MVKITPAVYFFCMVLCAGLVGSCAVRMNRDDQTELRPQSACLSATADSNALGLRREGTKIIGNQLVGSPGDGSGVLIGFGRYSPVSDRTMPVSNFEKFFCFIASKGFNKFRVFTSLGFGGKRNEFVSPWKNTQEWTSRRDAMLDAAAKCRVYVQMALFDETDRTSPERREGFDYDDNTWRGQDPSLEVAKSLTENYYLKGIDPNSDRGRALIVEHANEPAGNWWRSDWDAPFDEWLASKGFKFTAVNVRDGMMKSVADLVEKHIDGDDVSGDMQVAEGIQSSNSRPVSLSTDGGGFLSPDVVADWVRQSLANQVSFEFLMSSLNNNLALDEPTSDPESDWKGKTLRQFISDVASKSGIKPTFTSGVESGEPQPTPDGTPVSDPVDPTDPVDSSDPVPTVGSPGYAPLPICQKF